MARLLLVHPACHRVPTYGTALASAYRVPWRANLWHGFCKMQPTCRPMAWILQNAAHVPRAGTALANASRVPAYGRGQEKVAQEVESGEYPSI